MSASYNLTHNLTHAPIRVPSDDGLPCSRCTRVHTSLLILHINWYLICMSVQHHRVRCTNAAETHRFCLRVPRVLQSPLLRAFPYLLTVLLLSSMDASRQVQAFLVAPIMATGVISGASLHGTRSCSRNGADEEIATLSPPVLELITPDGIASSPDASLLILSVKRAVAGGVSLVQLRDYESDEESKTSLALDLLAATRGQALFVFNGEPDAARACGAHGVHLPERMMSRMEGLRDEGQGKWPRVKGCSVHSVEAAVTAARLGADYVQVGTMFATQSHPGKEPEGVGLLTDVKRHLAEEGFGNVLVIGVGGINASNCGKVATAGGDGVAAIRCLCDAASAEGEARKMMDSLRGSSIP